MNNIGQLIERGFFSGIVIAAVLVGFAGFLFLEEALQFCEHGKNLEH